MMKKFTTLLLALVLSLSTFLGLTTVSNVHAEEENAPVAKEPINLYREELATYSDIMTMRDSKLIYDGGVYFNALKNTPLLKLFSWMVLLRLRLKAEMWCLRTNCGISDWLEDVNRRQGKGMVRGCL